jgi:sigma-B regulation protein RsbU (phosphoserine phosphatase)
LSDPGRPSADECAGLDILGELEPGRLGAVLPHCRVQTFDAGQMILRRDAANEHLHFVLSGRVHVHFDVDNRSQPIEIGVGGMFGDLSVIDSLPVSAFVTAAEPCRILRLPADVFFSDVITVPGIARSVMRVLSGRVRINTMALSAAMREHLRHATLERELGIARDIQTGMLKRADPWFPGRRDVDLVAFARPAREVGGDFYDAFFLDADHLVIAIGDVADKGISAAMLMVRALTLIRGAASHWVSLAAAARDVNVALAADNDIAMFLTLFMGVLDTRTGLLDYVNYGHVPPLILSPGGAAAFADPPPGTVLGLIEDAECGAGSISLPAGTTLLLYTDGITEALDARLTLFGAPALRAAAMAAPRTDPGAIVRHVTACVAAHAGAAEQSDDITLLAVRYNGRGPATPRPGVMGSAGAPPILPVP